MALHPIPLSEPLPSENAAHEGIHLAYAIGSFAPARMPAHNPVQADTGHRRPAPQRVAGHPPPPCLPGRLHPVPCGLGRRSLVIREVAMDPVAEGEAVFLTVEPRHCVLLED